MKAIVDCNSFYCACERLFRPDIAHRPVVVLSNNDGCIISRSDEAKLAGVPMGSPFFESRHLIKENGVQVFSSNYHLYGDLSQRVMDTLRTLSANVEVYSVDEAYLDLSVIPEADLADYAFHIKHTVEQWTGISVSVGVAPTKTLAKVANHLAKRDKSQTGCVQLLADPESIRAALQRTRVNEIWGVGGAYARKLINWGITSALELSRMPESWAYRHLGGINGTRLLRELNGDPSILIKRQEDLPLRKKMIATTRMFGRPVVQLSELKEAVATYISRAAEKLRRQHSAANIVSVFIIPREEGQAPHYRYPDMKQQHTTLRSATSLTHELIKPAMELVESLYEPGKSYKKAGVILSGLVPDQSIQGNVFGPDSRPLGRFLMNAVDNVNFSMRDDILRFGSSGMRKDWKMRQEMRSGRYSTRWNELQRVH